MKAVFKWFTLNTNESLAYKSWFVDTFDIRAFDDGLDKLLFVFLQFTSEIGVAAKANFLQSFLRTDGKRIVAEYNIKLPTMENYLYSDAAALEEAFRVISSTVVQVYDEYCSIDLEERDFKTDMFEYLQTQKKEKTQSELQKVFPMFLTGEIDNILDTIESACTSIRQQYDIRSIQRVDNYLKRGPIRKDTIGSLPFLSKTHIPAIDNDVGGILGGMIYTYSALPGSGKSRLQFINFGYIPAVYYGKDVRIESMELNMEKTMNILISRHIITLFNGQVQIPDSLINQGKLTDEQRKYVEAARIDLFENPNSKYGTIKIVAREPIVLDTFDSMARNYMRLNPGLAIWDFDYAGLCKQDLSKPYTKALPLGERIEKFYEIVAGLVNDFGIAAMVNNQYNTSGENKAIAGIVPGPMDIHGGNAIDRYADYSMNMIQTPDQQLAHLMQISTSKVRGASGFNKVPVNLSGIGSSVFTQISNVNLS